jgi:hypothetical protein
VSCLNIFFFSFFFFICLVSHNGQTRNMQYWDETHNGLTRDTYSIETTTLLKEIFKI